MSNQYKNPQMDTIPELPELEVIPVEPTKKPDFNEAFGFEFPIYQIRWDRVSRYTHS